MYTQIKYYFYQLCFLASYLLMPSQAKALIQLPEELRPEFVPDVAGTTVDEKVTNLTGNLIITVMQLAGGVAIIMLIITAFRYVLARGEEEKVSQAKTTMFWIIGGLLLLMTSYIIVRFVIKVTLVADEAN